MRRHIRPPVFGSSAAGVLSPLTRMCALLIVLGLIYSWARNPQSWRWLENESIEPTATNSAVSTEGKMAPPAKAPSRTERIVAGPTDQDPSEAAAGRRLFEALSDRSALSDVEMPAYWRCLKWARAQSFDELKRRAADGVMYTRLFEQ